MTKQDGRLRSASWPVPAWSCAGLIIILALGSAGCRPADMDDAAWRERATGYRGILLPEPRPKPDFTLTDTAGRPFRFRAETDGQLTLLFFGYTYCPDICPVHMANLGYILSRFPFETRSRIRVVFVTTDPARDTPERIREWLDAFDPRFVGLRGELDEVNRIQQELGLPPAMLGEADDAGRYEVGHSAQVLAFTPDNLQRVTYLFGTRQADWQHDLPKLLREFGG